MAHATVGRDSGTRPRDSGANNGTCEKLNIRATPVAPRILIVLDRSGSMIGLADPRQVDRWTPSVRAVTAVTAQLTSTVEFGLMTFPSGNDDVCMPGRVDVPVALGSAPQIASVLASARPTFGSTPTAATLDAAYAQLSPSCVDCVDPAKYVLLVTDGQPTCGSDRMATPTPETINATITAIDRLTQAGITTYVVGYDTASDPVAAANMDRFAMHGGTQKHIPVDDGNTLLTELTRIASSLISCEYQLDGDISDPDFVRVTIDDLQQSRRDGAWRADGDKIILEGACDLLRDAKSHLIQIVRECEPVEVI